MGNEKTANDEEATYREWTGIELTVSQHSEWLIVFIAFRDRERMRKNHQNREPESKEIEVVSADIF